MLSHRLMLTFDTDSPEFSRGVEVGRLWEQFKHPEAFEQTIRADNAEMVLRIADQTGRRCRAEQSSNEHWMFLTVEEARDV